MILAGMWIQLVLPVKVKMRGYVVRGNSVKREISQFSPKFHSGSSTQVKILGLTNLIKIYFDFMFFLGACPVRFIKESGSTGFYATQWLPQKILCGLANALGILSLISGLREQVPQKSALLKANPKPYFDSLYAFCFLMYKLVSMKRLWFNWDKYLRVLNLIAKETNLPNHKRKIVLKHLSSCAFSIVLYGFILVEVVTCIVGGFTFISPIWKWTPEWYLRRLVAQSRFVFFLQEAPSPPHVAPSFSEITIWDWPISLLTLIGEIRRGVLVLYADVIILAIALTLWIPAKSFAIDIDKRLMQTEELDQISIRNNMQTHQMFDKAKLRNVVAQIQMLKDTHYYDQQHETWLSIYQSYRAIRQLSSQINTALGSQVTWYLAEGLMYYSSQLNTILYTVDPLQYLVTMIFYGVTIIILFVAADTNHQVESIKTWLTTNENFKNAPYDEVHVVLHEVQATDIGIRGSNIFTITYHLLGGLFSMVVTFFIICVQFGGDGIKPP